MTSHGATFFDLYGPGDLKVVANNLFLEQSVGVLGQRRGLQWR